MRELDRPTAKRDEMLQARHPILFSRLLGCIDWPFGEGMRVRKVASGAASKKIGVSR
jgi:hypothetical protein